MKTLAIILAALILPALCYVAWKWSQRKVGDSICKMKEDMRGDPTEIADIEYRGWKPKER